MLARNLRCLHPNTFASLKTNVSYHGVKCLASQSKRGFKVWADVPMGPPDPIFGITEAYKKDGDVKKMNLGAGTYRDDAGKPYVLPSVRQAETELLSQKLDKEYAPITGIPSFRVQATKLAYGDVYESIKDRLVSAQSISGTGALCIAANFLASFYPSKTIYVSDPTWGNHKNVFSRAGLTVKSYKYYDPATRGLDIKGMLSDLTSAPDGSIILLHACAHNPTGVDPTKAQWDDILKTMQKKNHFALLDMAYQGFASGDFARDAYATRLFASSNVPMLLCQSFAKNMGLYGERAGCFSILANDAEEAARIESQTKILIRALYSNPPVNGARIANHILSNPALREQWAGEVVGMSERLKSMRKALRNILEKDLKNKHSWKHITDQIGMFCYTGLNPQQVDVLAKQYHIYLTKNGRISISGLNTSNVRYFAEAINAVTSN
ncbi:Aspartate aminotransferase, mitochondrial [Schizosaccharomyces pombe]|uniref:Aspartate aminotransferase, mitochondrial n=1 Tax=Schizosaccharomyces pombe (strain 972 / ATCC 24843) TaxID=284812 RepID=AATM_SCHPO|nr:putative aspartate aminotransferase [Schizosaccharomyces pombe]O94320.1 RecName: Full=Aspartate aminotransferase, mitochondrial; AltName: Full=Transaminase A; Flags: Precursor [Schizosaccharomyces pombe 972h-]CAA22173.1 aspartate aminotransferase (predicted) [Schizosaccharomyces pombe]|eukprot:NP_595481.1 putative aspartate aminotransferase [Schizosaccharomyces pombe]